VSSPLSLPCFLRQRLGVSMLLVLGCLFLTQCGEDKATNPTSIDQNIVALFHLDQITPYSERAVGEEEINTYECDGRTYECTEQEHEVAAAFDWQLSLNPTSDVIWPGGLINGATIPTGEYTPIVADRAPLTVSISLVHIAGDKSKTVEHPALSSMRNAIAEILAQEVTGATAAFVTFEIEDIHSESQLDIALGATYRRGLSSVKDQFNFSNTEVLSRTLVKFMQVYYTIDVDVPQRPSDLFDSSVTWSDLDGQIGGSTSPMYVSSISYGRMALFTFESRYSSTQVKNALDATYESVKDGGSGHLSYEYETMLAETSIKGTIIGGSGASAVDVVNGFEGLKTYMTQGGNYDKNTAAAPLSYTLRYLSDNGICQVVLAQNYVVRSCNEMKPGYYAVRTTATYAARLMVDYTLNGLREHHEGQLLESPFGTLTDHLDVPARATEIVVEARSIWLGTTPTIFKFNYDRPTVDCWLIKGILGSSPSYEDLETCNF
jgi:thiol-activated cytolysin